MTRPFDSGMFSLVNALKQWILSHRLIFVVCVGESYVGIHTGVIPGMEQVPPTTDLCSWPPQESHDDLAISQHDQTGNTHWTLGENLAHVSEPQEKSCGLCQ